MRLCRRARAGARRGDSVHARAKRAHWARLDHARDVFDQIPGHARGLQSTRELAGWGYRLGQIHVTCWSSQGIKFIMQTKTHAKSVHAHKVFDKMPQAPRHFLGWPKLPEWGLFR